MPTPVDTYITTLRHTLRGPRRPKSSLLKEAHDGLTDATEAYEASGLDPATAETRAIEDFGTVNEIAPAFQAELAVTQARRTALLICAVLVPQPFAWKYGIAAVLGATSTTPTAQYAILDRTVSWLGTASIALALVAALSCGIGVRYFGYRRGLVRATGYFALAVSVVFATTAPMMAVFSAHSAAFLSVAGLMLMAVFLGAPMAWIALSAHRCLRTAALVRA